MTPVDEQDIARLRAEGDLGVYLRQIVADSRAQQEQDRALVLGHEDLAKQLTQPPMSFTRPECWTGYIPPETCKGLTNTSPIRAALVRIVTEARRRAGS